MFARPLDAVFHMSFQDCIHSHSRILKEPVCPLGFCRRTIGRLWHQCLSLRGETTCHLVHPFSQTAIKNSSRRQFLLHPIVGLHWLPPQLQLIFRHAAESFLGIGSQLIHVDVFFAGGNFPVRKPVLTACRLTDG